MIGALPATTTGAAIGAVAVLGLALLGSPRRWLLPELSVVVVLVVAYLSGGLPVGTGALEVWGAAILHPTGPWLVGLFALYGLIQEPAADEGSGDAILGGLAGGSLATAARLVPSATSATSAARLSLVAVAAGVCAPFGTPAALLLAGGALGYSLFALVPAAIAVAIAWPWPARAGEPSRWVVGAAAGIVVTFLLGPLAGLLVAIAGVAALTRARLRLGRILRLVRWAIAVHLLASVAQITFVAWHLAQLHALAVQHGGLAGMWALGAAIGLVADPALAAAVLARSVDLSAAEPDAVHALALGLAMAPSPVLLLAARAHGPSVLSRALPIVAVQLAVTGVWIAIAPW